MNLNIARVKFLCGRRGMKELDEILAPFFEKHFDSLNDHLKNDFAVLLEQEETALFDWLVLGKEPQDENLKEIVGLICRPHLRGDDEAKNESPV